MEIMIVIAMVAAAVTVVAIVYDRADARAKLQAEQARQLEAESERRRIKADARRDERAAAYYIIQESMATIRRQAEIQGQTGAAALASLGDATRMLGEADQEAVQALRARATVDAYTQMLISQKAGGQERKKIAPARPWVEQ